MTIPPRIALLLACAHLAPAIPLHTGNSWTWLVVDPANNDTALRVARILDSVGVDSGTAWRIEGKDSLTGAQDTGRILRRADGSQAWMASSAWLPWEPGQPPAILPSHDTAGATLPWGMSMLLSLGHRAKLSTPVTVHRTDSSLECDYEEVDVRGSYTCPQQILDPVLGMVRGRIMEFAQGGDRALDWFLVARNGGSAPSLRDTLVVPAVGTVLAWRRDSTDSIDQYPTGIHSVSRARTLLRWTLQSRDADSSGWVRLSILVSREDSDPAGSVQSLRLNPLTGQRLPPRGNCPTPDDGWWRTAWGRTRSWHGNWAQTTSGGANVQHIHTLDDQADIIDCSTNLTSMESSMMNPNPRQIDENHVLRLILLSIDDRQIHDATLGIRAKATIPGGSSLRAIAAQSPALPVRWRDLRGRTGQISASSLARGHVGSGLLLLEATLPDGTRWSGSLLTTGR